MAEAQERPWPGMSRKYTCTGQLDEERWELSIGGAKNTPLGVVKAEDLAKHAN